MSFPFWGGAAKTSASSESHETEPGEKGAVRSGSGPFLTYYRAIGYRSSIGVLYVIYLLLLSNHHGTNPNMCFYTWESNKPRIVGVVQSTLKPLDTCPEPS